MQHNERLEFVGDAVLACAIAASLYERFPQLPEGHLSRMRAHLVNRDTLAGLARGLELGHAVRVGEEERKRGGAELASTLADALEAVFGAVFLDGGFDEARKVIERVYAEDLGRIDPARPRQDAKTRLQEWLQAQGKPVPQYVVVETRGEAHAPSIAVECRIPTLGIVASAVGRSRRVAEQVAAERAYESLAGAKGDA